MNIQSIIMVLIIVILGIVFVMAYLRGGVEANDKMRLNDVAQIQAALQSYYDESGFYPLPRNGIPSHIETYLSFWPTPPAADGSCTSEQNQYVYSQKGGGTDYSITFCLGGTVGEFDPGIHTVSSKGIE